MNYLLRFLTSATTLVCWLLSNSATAQSLAFDRAVVCASGGGYYGWGPTTIALDAQSNTYVAGRFNGTIALGNTLLTATTQIGPNSLVPVDNFVAKLDAAGTYLWATQIGGLHESYIGGVVSDNRGGVYVTGAFGSFSVRFGANGPTLFNSSAQREGFVAKLDAATGQWLWARRAGGTGNDNLGTAVVNAAGDLYVLGGSGSATADVGPFTLTGPQTFLARLTPAGTWLWTRRLGVQPAGSLSAGVNLLALDAQENIYVGGAFGAPSIDFGGTTLQTQVIAGSPRGGRNRFTEVFVAKMSAAGAWLWAVQGDAVTQQNLASAAMVYDGAGHVYVSGAYEGPSVRIGNTVLPNLSAQGPQPNPLPPVPYTNNYYPDAFVARLDATTGIWDWAVRNGGPGSEAAFGVLLNPRGGAYVTGGFVAPGSGQLRDFAQIDPATGA